MKSFYNCHRAAHSHHNAQIIARSNLQHEGHFGITIRNSHTQRSKLRRQCRADRLKECLQLALGWIDAVPQETVLPVMPGFDRDYVDGVIHDCD